MLYMGVCTTRRTVDWCRNYISVLYLDDRVVWSRGHPCIHAQGTGWQLGQWSCIIPGLPAHLVQELNIGTVNASFMYGKSHDLPDGILLLALALAVNTMLQLGWRERRTFCSYWTWKSGIFWSLCTLRHSVCEIQSSSKSPKHRESLPSPFRMAYEKNLGLRFRLCLQRMPPKSRPLPKCNSTHDACWENRDSPCSSDLYNPGS